MSSEQPEPMLERAMSSKNALTGRHDLIKEESVRAVLEHISDTINEHDGIESPYEVVDNVRKYIKKVLK